MDTLVNDPRNKRRALVTKWLLLNFFMLEFSLLQAYLLGVLETKLEFKFDYLM